MPEGNVDDLTREKVVGWALDRDNLAVKETAVIRVNGSEVARCTAASVRRFNKGKVTGQTEVGCGFSYRFDPPLSQFQNYTVEVCYASTGKRIPGGVKSFECPPPGKMKLRPIIVNARGRSGTTMLMKEFLNHPEIAVADIYPYEVKLASYYVSAYRVLAASSPSDRDPGFVELAATKSMIGRNPFNEAWMHRRVGKGGLQKIFEPYFSGELAALFREVVARYYDEVASIKPAGQVRFFAEKAMIDEELRLGLRMLLGDLREIIMVRDPRDLLCSAKSFWKMSDAVAFRTVQESVEGLTAIRAAGAEDTLFVRYEDLIEKPLETRETIYRFIGTEPAPMQDESEMETLRRQHATTKDLKSSIGRWQAELAQDEVLACLDRFDGFMRAFGYLPAQGAGGGDFAGVEAAPRAIFSIEGERPRQRLFLNDAAQVGGAALRAAGKRLTLDFATGGNGKSVLGKGWSVPERDFCWSCAGEANLLLPALPSAGGCILEFTGRPFLAGGRAAGQTVMVLANGVEIGQAVAAEPALFRCYLPPGVLGDGQPIALTLQFPGALRPKDVIPGSNDARLLGLALERMALYGPLADPG